MFSLLRELLCGVAPGSMLGPILFNTYLNDLFLFSNGLMFVILSIIPLLLCVTKTL